MTAPKEIAIANLARVHDGFWTEARLGELLRLAAEGYSFGQIAEAIGATRSQVAGKTNRLKIKVDSRSRRLALRKHKLELARRRATMRARLNTARAIVARLEDEARALGVEP